MTFEIILGILIAGIITNNFALIEMLGTGAVIENERSKELFKNQTYYQLMKD